MKTACLVFEGSEDRSSYLHVGVRLVPARGVHVLPRPEAGEEGNGLRRQGVRAEVRGGSRDAVGQGGRGPRVDDANFQPTPGTRRRDLGRKSGTDDAAARDEDVVVVLPRS